jgi:predicted transcriptional regulator
MSSQSLRDAEAQRLLSDHSYTIAEFCTAERISRSMLYKLWSQGQGPRWFNIGSCKRISHEARTEWRRRREAEAAAAISSNEEATA